MEDQRMNLNCLLCLEDESTNDKVSCAIYHNFPKQGDTFGKWVAFVKHCLGKKFNFQDCLYPRAHLCSRHFRSSDYTYRLMPNGDYNPFLKAGAIPTVFQNNNIEEVLHSDNQESDEATTLLSSQQNEVCEPVLQVQQSNGADLSDKSQNDNLQDLPLPERESFAEIYQNLFYQVRLIESNQPILEEDLILLNAQRAQLLHMQERLALYGANVISSSFEVEASERADNKLSFNSDYAKLDYFLVKANKRTLEKSLAKAENKIRSLNGHVDMLFKANDDLKEERAMLRSKVEILSSEIANSKIQKQIVSPKHIFERSLFYKFLLPIPETEEPTLDDGSKPKRSRMDSTFRKVLGPQHNSL